MADKLQKLGPFTAGINNVQPVTNVPNNALRDAVNFDLDDAGKARVRGGYTKLIEGTNAHSLWGADTTMLYVNDGAMYQLDPATMATISIAAGFSTRSVSYARVGSLVYFSDGRNTGRYDLATGTYYPGFTLPAPSVIFGSAGGETTHVVAATYLGAMGESGTTPLIHITGTPTVTYSGVAPIGAEHLRIYVTPDGGQRESLYAADTIRATTPLTNALVYAGRGRACETQYLEPLPAGDILRIFHGRMYSAVGSVVYYSEALRYGLYNPMRGLLLQFPERVTVMEPTPQGLFVVADRTYFFAGTDPTDFKLRDDSHNFPAVFGSGCQVPGHQFTVQDVSLPETVPYWFSSRGAVLGLPDGRVHPLTMGRAEPAQYERGASGLLEIDGISKVVTAVRGKTQEANAIALTDSASFTVIKTA
jgi:hypothetical protein